MAAVDGSCGGIAWNDVLTRNVADITTTCDDMKRARDDLTRESDTLKNLTTDGQWSGKAATAAQKKESTLRDRLEHVAAHLAGAQSAFSHAEEGVRDVVALRNRATNHASSTGLTIDPAGTVSDTRTPPSSFPDQESADAYTKGRNDAVTECLEMVTARLTRAGEVDTDLNTRLESLDDESYGDGGKTDLASAAAWGAQDAGRAPSPPPATDASPAENRDWWQGLTKPQRDDIIAEHREWIGNRDGIDYASRNAANQRRLPGEIDRAREAERAHAAKEPKKTTTIHDKEGSFETTTGEWHRWDLERQRLENNRKSLEKLQSVTHTDPNHQLVTLRVQDGKRVQAAVSSGDLDKATHIATYTPGATSNVEHIDGPVKDMDALRRRAETELRTKGQRGTAANVVWLDYQAPPDIAGWNDQAASRDMAAQEAAPRLANYYRGIDATHHGSVEQSAFGHSYGSLVTATALRESDTGVDRVAYFGSPGLGTSAADDHDTHTQVPKDRQYNILANDDAIELGTVHGEQPSRLPGITELEDDSVPARHLSGSHGHSEYLKDGSTAQENLAYLLAGEDANVIRRHDPAPDWNTIQGGHYGPGLK